MRLCSIKDLQSNCINIYESYFELHQKKKKSYNYTFMNTNGISFFKDLRVHFYFKSDIQMVQPKVTPKNRGFYQSLSPSLFIFKRLHSIQN